MNNAERVDQDAAGILYRVNPPVSSAALNVLFAASWPTHTETDFETVLRHSLLYICAYQEDQLVGFVKVIWDGGVHGFLLDTTVQPAVRRRRIGEQLVRRAAAAAQAKGLHWLHVDYEPHLNGFYQQCGFVPTQAGLMRLNSR